MFVLYTCQLMPNNEFVEEFTFIFEVIGTKYAEACSSEFHLFLNIPFIISPLICQSIK